MAHAQIPLPVCVYSSNMACRHGISLCFSMKNVPSFLSSAAAINWDCLWLCLITLVGHEEGKRCVTLSVWSGALAGVNALYISWQTQQPLNCLCGLETRRHNFSFTLPACKISMFKRSIANLGNKECVVVFNMLQVVLNRIIVLFGFKMCFSDFRWLQPFWLSPVFLRLGFCRLIAAG